MRELSDRENALVAFGREHDINLSTSSPLPFFIHCNDENGRKRPHYKLPADDRELREFARDIGRECCHPKDGTLPDDARPRLFWRGMSPVFVNAETKRLEAMSAELFRTWAGQFVACYCLRYRGAYNEGVIRTMNLDTARGVLASHEFLDQAAQIERLTTHCCPLSRQTDKSSCSDLVTSQIDASSLSTTGCNLTKRCRSMRRST